MLRLIFAATAVGASRRLGAIDKDYRIVELLTNAKRFPSGDHDGTLIVP
jgi:hypothetical protein